MNLNYFIIGSGDQTYCCIIHRNFPLNHVIWVLGILRVLHREVREYKDSSSNYDDLFPHDHHQGNGESRPAF